MLRCSRRRLVVVAQLQAATRSVILSYRYGGTYGLAEFVLMPVSIVTSAVTGTDGDATLLQYRKYYYNRVLLIYRYYNNDVRVRTYLYAHTSSYMCDTYVFVEAR